MLFNLKGNRIIPDPNMLMIPAFRAVWLSDESEDKEKAMKELTYVYFFSDYKSPYRNSYDQKDLKKALGTAIFKMALYEPNQLVKKAIEEYENLQDTLSLKALKSAKSAVYKLRLYLEDIDFDKTDKQGKPVYKIPEILKTVQSMGPIIKSINVLQEQVEKELSTNVKLRGGGVKGRREDPKHGRS